MLSLRQFQRNSGRIVTPLILLALAIVSLFIQILAANPIRMVFGLILVLVLPGYSLTLIMFRLKCRLSGIERVGTTIFLSIAIVSFIGIFLNRTSYGIQLNSVLICIVAVVLFGSVIIPLLTPKESNFTENVDGHEPKPYRKGDKGVISFVQKYYEVFGLGLACVLIYILNTLPYFSGQNLLDVDEWMHLAQVDYVLINGHITTYSLDQGIMVRPQHYPPAFHTFVAILIQFTNFQDIFVFKWIYLAIFGPFLILATYLTIYQFAGKKKALVTSFLLATWMTSGGTHGPLWRVPSTFSIGLFMFCLYSLMKYYDTKKTSYLVTGGMALGLVLLSHNLSGPILFLSLSCFLFLRIISHRTVAKEDVYFLGMMGVNALIAGIFYWFFARGVVSGIAGKVWGRSWEWTNWFDLTYLFLRPPLLLIPFALFVILRTYKRDESLLLITCFIVGSFFSFSYFVGIYMLNTRFALFFTLISYALSGLGLFEAIRFLLNLHPNIRISLVALLAVGYALIRIIYPLSNRTLYIAHKAAYDFYANFMLGALILMLIVFIVYRTVENPDILVALFTILIVIASSISTAIFTTYSEPMLPENEALAMLWLKESQESNTIIIYETKELAWFGGELNAPIARLYGETNYSLRLIDRDDILTSPDTDLTIELLNEYHITYIVTYTGGHVSQKFQSLTVQLPHNFRIVYQNEAIVIYEFIG